MTGQFILAIDQGTTSSRAIVFNRDGRIMNAAQKELTLSYPDNGWVEQDPEHIWQDTLATCRDVIEAQADGSKAIAGIGITNQRETCIIWDRETGKPIYNAIVWQDRRTAPQCADLREAGHEPMIRSKTGLLLDPYFSATKLAWILDHVDGARERAEAGQLAMGTIDCFLLYRLTGGVVHATDATNASRTMLYNIREQCWDDELLELFNIPRSLLPEVKDNAGDFGMTAAEHFGDSLPIAGVAGDQQAATIGQACFEAGMMKSTYGTGCFALMNIGPEFRESSHRLLTTIAYRLDGEVTYAMEGSIFVAGAAIQWLRDGLGIIDDAGDSEALATSVDSSNGVYMVPAFTGLGSPYWQPDARGALLGLTRDTTQAHIARAALEAQAYQSYDLIEAMMADVKRLPDTIRVDGGLVKNEFMCQFLSDLINRPVELPEVTETTALGAAYLAGLQLGIYQSLNDIAEAWECARRYDPDMGESQRLGLYAGWKKAVHGVLSLVE